MGLLTSLDIKTYYKVKVIRIVCYQQNNSQEKKRQKWFRNRHNAHRNLLHNKVGISDVVER
jgi:hypothetical protein